LNASATSLSRLPRPTPPLSATINHMFVAEFLTWWYGAGWKTVFDDTKRRFQAVSSALSLAIITKTLFAPWRRIISYPGSALGDHLRAAIDNLISRIIGFFLRMGVLVVAAVMFVLIGLTGLIEIVAWPMLPVGVIVFIIWGII
jgi:hypothetical protein